MFQFNPFLSFPLHIMYFFNEIIFILLTRFNVLKSNQSHILKDKKKKEKRKKKKEAIYECGISARFVIACNEFCMKTA